MSKKIIIIFMILILSGMSFSLNATSFNQVTKLSTLAKVWGLLKYFHPTVTSKFLDMDVILIDAIGPVKESQDVTQFNIAINSLINKVGGVNFLTSPDLSDFDIQEDSIHAWIKNDSLLNWYTAFKLKILISNFKGLPNKYFSYDETSCFESISKAEYKYENSDLSEEYRLLSIFRYWNVINYFYPNKHLMDKKWESVLEEFIPKFQNAKTNLEYHLTVTELTTQINDSHSFTNSDILTEFWGVLYAPFKCKLIDGKTVVYSFHESLLDYCGQLLPGDIITQINSVKIEKIREELKKYIGASNLWGMERKLNTKIFRGNDRIMELTIVRKGIISNVFITRYEVKTLNELYSLNEKKRDKWKILDGNIGYIDMGILEIPDVDTAMKALMNTKTIIFDIRNYPNQTAFYFLQYLSYNEAEFFLYRNPDPLNIGRFLTRDGTNYGYIGKGDYKGKLVVLANELTQSQAETSCMLFQVYPGATTIGSHTSGANGCGTKLYLPGGIQTGFSGSSILYPDGREMQRAGIDIDIIIEPSIQGITDGKDEVLDRAIEFINQSLEK